jgi:hypothetical protein
LKHGPSRHHIKKKYCLRNNTTFAHAVGIILVTRNVQTSKEVSLLQKTKAEKMGLRVHEEKKIVLENIP